MTRVSVPSRYAPAELLYPGKRESGVGGPIALPDDSAFTIFQEHISKRSPVSILVANMSIGLITPVYCSSLPVVQNLFSCPLFFRYGIAGNRYPRRIRCSSPDCRIIPSRFGLEHPRRCALRCCCLPS